MQLISMVSFINFQWSVECKCMYMCGCVCLKERGREREKERGSELNSWDVCLAVSLSGCLTTPMFLIGRAVVGTIYLSICLSVCLSFCLSIIYNSMQTQWLLFFMLMSQLVQTSCNNVYTLNTTKFIYVILITVNKGLKCVKVL